MINKNIFLFLLVSVFLFSFVSSDLGTYAQGSNVSVRGEIIATSVNVTIYFPNSTVAINNQPMTNLHSKIWNYTFTSTDNLGYYIYDYCDQNGNNCVQNFFKINYYGHEVSTSQAIIYIILFLVLLFTFFITLFGINQLPKSNQQDEEGRILSVTYLKYLRPVGWMFEYMLFVAMLYMTSNIAFAYLNEQLFAKVLFMLFKVSFGFAPLIVIGWVAWIYVQMFHDKKFQELLNRGFFPQGKDY